MNLKKVWSDVTLLRQDEITHAHTHTNIPGVINTDKHACATPHHTVWHTDWLILWWARLWHTDCAVTTTETALPPSLCLPLFQPPLVSMQFLAEKLLPIPPPIHLYFPLLLWRMEIRMRGKRKRTQRRRCGRHRETTSHSFGEHGALFFPPLVFNLNISVTAPVSFVCMGCSL